MKIFRSRYFNLFFFLVTTAFVLALNLYPLFKLAQVPVPGRTYGLIHNNVQDFYFYQSLMNEGANGAFIIYDPFTTEPHQSSIIFSYFTWAGKISKILNIPHAYTYHGLRLIFALLFFTAAYRLLWEIKSPYPNLTYLFFLFASPVFNGDTPFMYWWTGMDAVRRAAYLPHHMLGGAALISVVIFILRFFNSKKIKNIFYALLLSIIMAFVHTPSLIILLIFLPFACCIQLLKTLRQKNNNVKYILQNKFYPGIIVFWLLSLLFLAFMVSQTNKGFPWNQYLLWERNLQYPLVSELTGALGFLTPFAVLGLLISYLTANFSGILIASWFIFPFLLIPFAGLLGMSDIRLIQGVPYLTLSILAATGIGFLLRISRKIKYLDGVILATVCIFFALFSYRTIVWSIKDQIREFSNQYSNVYLDNRLKDMFTYINGNYPKKIKILATFYTGNYLPVYTAAISFIGHTGYSNNLKLKEPLVDRFFRNEMTENEALVFLKVNGIDLVFQGPDEKNLYFKEKLYPGILKIVYDRDVATLYTLK